MLSKLPRLFVYSAGTLLLFTAAAKLVSSGGDARILQMTDPIVGIRFRNLLWLVGGVELVVAVVCL
jgi:thioesterase domain-containing protein